MAEKVRILAFDPGTASMGYGTIEGNLATAEVTAKKHFGVLKSSLEDGEVRKRIDLLGAEYLNLLHVIHPTHVVIEDFTEQGSRTSRTIYKDMGSLIEHLRMAGRSMGYDVSIFDNAFWKKTATGSSGLNKDQVKHFVAHKIPKAKELLGSRTANHVWDAYGIAYAKFKQLQGDFTNGTH